MDEKIIKKIRKEIDGMQNSILVVETRAMLQYKGYGVAKNYIAGVEREAKTIYKIIDMIEASGLSPEDGAVLIKTLCCRGSKK